MEEESYKENKKNNNLFSFGKINKYFILPFICPIFCMLGNLCISFIMEDNGLKNKEFFIFMITKFIDIIGGLLFFIVSIRTRTEETRPNAIVYKSAIKLIYNRTEKKRNLYKVFGIIFFLSSFSIIYDICFLFSYDKYIFQDRAYILFFIPFFSKIILKIDIFRHHILSLFISFIGMIFLFIPIILIIRVEDIIINICIFIAGIGYSLYMVLIKYLTDNYFFSPYLCLLLIGLLSFILTFIGFIIYSLIKNNDLSYIIDSFNFAEVENGIKTGLSFFGILFFGAIYEVLTFLVIFYFSPTLYMVTDIINPFLSFIINIFMYKEETINIIFSIIGFSIALLSSLIYNEIIICNFYGFNKKTKKYLEERQSEEIKSLRETEDENNLNKIEKDISYDSGNQNY